MREAMRKLRQGIAADASDDINGSRISLTAQGLDDARRIWSDPEAWAARLASRAVMVGNMGVAKAARRKIMEARKACAHAFAFMGWITLAEQQVVGTGKMLGTTIGHTDDRARRMEAVSPAALAMARQRRRDYIAARISQPPRLERYWDPEQE